MNKNTVHGHARRGNYSLTYRSWADMIKRTRGKGSLRNKKDYLDKGITVCKRWENFSNFLADMGERKNKSLSIGRINNKKGYSKSNCRWENIYQQANNRSNNKVINVYGESMTMMQASRKFNIDYRIIQSRVKRGWPAEKAVSIKPVKNANQKTYGDIKNASKYA